MRGLILAAALVIATSSQVWGQTAQPPRTPAAPAPPAAAPPADAPPSQVEVRSHLDRTAVWVGDHVVWTVEAICAPTIDVIADDFAAEKLSLAGLEVIGSETERITNADGTLTHRVRYTLSTYEISAPQVRVESFKVRYYERRPGQRADEVAPAGEAVIPAAVLAWRSTLPGGLSAIVLRERLNAESGPSLLAWARPVGLTLIVMSAAPVLMWAIARVRELRRPRERRPSARMSRRIAREALTTLRHATASTESERRDGYTQLNEIVRRYVADSTGVAAMAMTPEEVAARFNGNGSAHAMAALGDVLIECDRARYGSAAQMPTAEQFRDSVDTVNRLVQ